MSSSSGAPVIKTLGDVEGNVVRQLIGGHAPSIASVVMGMRDVKEALLSIFTDTISDECKTLCRNLPDHISQFRSIPVTKLVEFTWVGLIEELEAKAPTLVHLITAIVSHRDHLNKSKVGTAHYPGICAVAALLLKERNREMCGLQSLVSVMMYLCHCEKQVCISIHVRTYIHFKLKHVGLQSLKSFEHVPQLFCHPAIDGTVKPHSHCSIG